jgi:hypothetical protein
MVIVIYSMSIGYGLAAFIYSIFLSLFSVPSILLSWIVVVRENPAVRRGSKGAE